MLIAIGLINEPFILTHNYIGVMLALFMQQFPFCFLMLLGYISGIDPSLESSARMLGATPWTVFRRVMLPLIAPGLAIAFALVFVMSFAVFPSAVMLGQPAGATRTISIAAYQQAFEQYDMSDGLGDRGDHGAVPAGGAARHHPVPAPAVAGGDDGCREAIGEHVMRGRMWKLALYLFIAGFILNMLGIVTHVVVSVVRQALVRQPAAAGLHHRLVQLCLDQFRSRPGARRHAVHRGRRGGAGAG